VYVGPQPDDLRAGLRLARVDHMTFDQRTPFHDYDLLYFKDLWELFGLKWTDELAAGGRVTFEHMITALLDRLGPRARGLDVAVLANATPDSEAVFPVPYIEEAIGGIGTVFAVSDQGAAAPFTALRLASSTLPPGEHGRSLVIVLDQTAVPEGPPIPADLRPRQNSAVALLLERDGALGRPLIRQSTDAGPAEIVAMLREAAGEPDDDLTLVCRAEFVPYWTKTGLDAEVLTVREGLPCTGLWAELAAHCARPSRRRRVLLADYDERLGYVSTCTLDIGGQP
jgi:hypothetical protein